MFCLWICLSLFCALQSQVSSDGAVSLICNHTVDVTVGENVALNCAIHWADNHKCKGDHYFWSNTNGVKLCDRVTKYSCESDLLNYVSLTILNIEKEENVTAEIHSDCGLDKSAPIRVQVHAVLLICNHSVEVTSGENVVLNCAIRWANHQNCEHVYYSWCNTNGAILCDKVTEYICASDLLKYVSLTILDIKREQSITAEIHSNCGMFVSAPIRVQVHAVSLICNHTVDGEVGENVALNCVVHWPDHQKCKGDRYFWRNIYGDELCDRVAEYSCDSDLLNYVSLTILNIKREQSITAEIHSNCGMFVSAPIRVQVHAVSLICNHTVEAAVGENVTLNCVIHWPDNKRCKGDHYFWRNTNGVKLCDRETEYSCESDLLKYVSLTILKSRKVKMSQLKYIQTVVWINHLPSKFRSMLCH